MEHAVDANERYESNNNTTATTLLGGATARKFKTVLKLAVVVFVKYG